MSAGPEDGATIRARLLEEREAIDAAEASSRDARRPLALDPGREGRLSRMAGLEQQAMLQAAQRRREIRRRRIEAALERLEAGEYGLCGRCEEAIEPKRLAFDPAAPLCGACARSVESGSR